MEEGRERQEAKVMETHTYLNLPRVSLWAKCYGVDVNTHCNAVKSGGICSFKMSTRKFEEMV